MEDESRRPMLGLEVFIGCRLEWMNLGHLVRLFEMILVHDEKLYYSVPIEVEIGQ